MRPSPLGEPAAPHAAAGTSASVADPFRTVPGAADARRFHQIATAAPVLMWTASPDGRRDWYNAPWLAFTGRTLEAQLSFDWLRGLHPDDVDSCGAAWAQMLATRDPYALEYRLRRHDGVFRWVQANWAPRYDDDGQFAGFIGTCTDVTEQVELRQRAERLQRLSADLTRGLTREEITATVLPHILAAFDACGAAVLEISEDGDEFVLLGARGFHDDLVQRFARFPVAAPLPAGEVLATRAPVFVPSAEEWRRRFADAPVLRTPDGGECAFAALPLLVDERVAGVLTVNTAGPHCFSEPERTFMRAFANVCAQAMERARLFEAEHTARVGAERSMARLVALQRVARALNNALSEVEIGRVIVQAGVLAIGAECGVFTLLTPDGASLHIVASHGYPPEHVAQFRTFALAEAVPLADAVRTGVPVMLRDRAARDEHYPQLMDVRGDDQGALAAVPMVSGSRAVGAFGATWRDPQDFDADEAEFLAALADQAAQALERTTLFARERVAHERAAVARGRAEFLANASRVLAGSLDYADTLEHVAHSVVPGLADWCSVDVVEDPASRAWPPVIERLFVHHTDPARVAWARTLRETLSPNWDARVGLPETLRTGAVQFFPEIRDEVLVQVARSPEELALFRGVGFRSSICVPLESHGTIFGALSLVRTENAQPFTEDDLALAVELASRAATAIANASLMRAAEDARRAAEEARRVAEEANASKAEFLATMSHELRTPLNAIGGYAELLELGIRGPVTAAQLEDLGRIKRSQRHLLGMINEVLNFARLEAGHLTYDLADVPLAALMRHVEPLILPQALAKRITLTLAPCDDDVTVHADAEKLQQIVLNLLSNAVKFTPAGGRVDVQCWISDTTGAPGVRAEGANEAGRRTRMAHIAVSDTGIGIDAAMLPRVFEPFVQVGRALDRPTDGAGLGLAISRDLARGMGGELRADSTPGAGSRFVVSIPA